MTTETKLFLIHNDFTIKQAMQKMTDIGQKVLFIVDNENRLIGSLSDGDIRKWVLDQGSLREKVTKICNKKPKFVKENFKPNEVKQLMVKLLIECVYKFATTLRSFL